ncbi:MAG: DUF5009 domain-containing protein [Bacteroidales bacterium]|nr:DUF5009 domain-containing protein [Bacteroidales bacterium]
MNQRIASIDIMRGITIAAMILCANIGFNSNLPAWMFHAQTPPPTYAFNPDVPGITWVDLVFPFFLFTMGAAIPLAMRKRIEKGVKPLSLIPTLCKRWFILTIFAIVLGNAYSAGGAFEEPWLACIFKIVIWTAMFLSLVRTKYPVINLSGVCMVALIGFLMVKFMGVPLDKGNSDIIILILANIALWGGLIWLFTRDNIKLRWLVFLFVAAVKALDSYASQVLSFLPSTGCAGWLLQWNFLQYLLIAIFGSIVGDMLLEAGKTQIQGQIDRRGVYAGSIALAVVILQLWGLFAREVVVDFILSLAGGAAYFTLTFKDKGVASQIARTGFALLLVGIIFDPVDGGITKDYANLSYLFTTGGMAALFLSFLLMLEMKYGVKCTFVAGVGQNPMLAYTVTSFLIGPVLTLCMIYPFISSLAVDSQFWGMVMGILMTLSMMGATFMFTKFKSFWRS